MQPITIVGVVVVNLALITYGIGIVMEQRSHRVSARVLRFLQVGVLLDIVATSCMIIGSSSGPLTLHGFLGFSALGAMLTETALAWKHRAANADDEVPAWLHNYSRVAYGWWCIAYVAGAALVMGGA